MDLSSIKPQEIFTVELRHPATDEPLIDDDGTAVSISVYGPGSDRNRAVRHKRANAYLKKGRKIKLTAIEVEKGAAEDLAELVCEVKGLEINGAPVTPENIVNLFLSPEFFWVKEQVDNAAGDYENFFRENLKN